MTLNNIINMSLTNMSRNRRRTIVYIIFISVSIIMIFTSISFIYTTYNAIDTNINNNTKYRSFELNIDDKNIPYKEKETLEYMRKTEHVVDIQVNREDNDSIKYIEVIVDDYRNVDNIVMKLNQEKYFNAYRYEENVIDESMINTMKKTSFFMFIIIIFFAFIKLSIIMVSIINERIIEIAIFKAIGYNNKNLFILIFVENIIMAIGSYLISVVISNGIINLIINTIIKHAIKSKLISTGLKLNLQIYFNTLIVLIILCLLTSIKSVIKTKKISPIKLLKS